jgi:hypothetical protein
VNATVERRVHEAVSQRVHFLFKEKRNSKVFEVMLGKRYESGGVDR